MPEWVIAWILPYVIQMLTPLILELAKKGAALVLPKLPRTAGPILAAAIGELLNQQQALFSGVPLPPGVPGLIAVGLNEFYNDLTKGLKPNERKIALP